MSDIPHALRSLINRHPKVSSVFIFLCWLVLALNLVTCFQGLSKIITSRQIMPYVFWGLKFSGLNGLLKAQRSAGYYTDKNMDERFNALQFAQAQYVLAPVILELNNTEHEFIIFDCSTARKALEKIKELGAVPLRVNPTGVIIARKLKPKAPVPEAQPLMPKLLP